MSIFVAVAHIVGSTIVLVLISVGYLVLAGWVMERHKKASLQEISLMLNIPIDDIENTEHEEKVFQFLSERCSSELFRNRLSDLCGVLLIIWGWAGNILQAGFLLGVIWYSITDGTSYSVNSWFVVGIALFFGFSSVIFTYACKLLTGRFPSQAKHGRKILAEILEERRLAIARTQKAT